jgi:hypothetical protein
MEAKGNTLLLVEKIILCKFLLGKNSPKLQLFPGVAILYLSD